ncbi:MAG: Na+/H+ antiporter subunit E [Desulfosarcinaceae bacterium]|nr:Na+/H+ antiporter subunit E [Desulfosarcinaceae bacterium]
MHVFALNLVFALLFALFSGGPVGSGLLAGFALGYLALWLTRPLYGPSKYFQRLPRIFGLLVYFTKELVRSNLMVLWDVLTPTHISQPGIVALPLTAKSDLEIFLVANLISLTPGTLSLDVSADRRYLYVHVMFLDDVTATCTHIKEGIERRILEVLR